MPITSKDDNKIELIYTCEGICAFIIICLKLYKCIIIFPLTQQWVTTPISYNLNKASKPKDICKRRLFDGTYREKKTRHKDVIK